MLQTFFLFRSGLNRESYGTENISMSARIFEFLKFFEQVDSKLRLVHVQRLKFTVGRQDALQAGHLGAIGEVHHYEKDYERYKHPDLCSS
jgi:hypothetical protein